MITFLKTHQPRIIGFIIGLVLGAAGTYLYIVQQLPARVSSLEQNQQAIINQTNINTNDLTNIKSFLQKAVEEANKK